jgi:hypothetical protein
MALTNSYLITTKNLDAFLNAIKTAKAPERFTNKFLEQLDFTSSNDRLFIGVLKALGFIDESSVPTSRYYQFLDQTQSGKILATAIKEAYDDLFSINKKANELSVEEVKNKFRTLTQGQKSENVLNLMSNTFKALSDLADWETTLVEPADKTILPPPKSPELPPIPSHTTLTKDGKLQLHYNIQIHLPESRDPAVYDAIFQSLRKHII